MFKFLTYLILSYFFYKYFIKPFFLLPGKENPLDLNSKRQPPKEKQTDDGEYIDYEEVD